MGNQLKAKLRKVVKQPSMLFRHEAEQRWVCDRLALVWLEKKLFASLMGDFKAGSLLSTSNYLVNECFIIQNHLNGTNISPSLIVTKGVAQNKWALSRLSLLIYVCFFFFKA